MKTTISHKLYHLIKTYEGLSLYPYACPASKLTIGYGHVIRNHDLALGINGKLLQRIFNGYKKFIPNYTALNKFLKKIFNRPITDKYAQRLLKYDILRFAKGVEALITVKLGQNQKDALISFAYNVGLCAFKKSTLLRFINVGDFANAAKQFDRWVFAKGKKLSGLVKRRHAEKNLFLTI